jgi:hypothetical protein
MPNQPSTWLRRITSIAWNVVLSVAALLLGVLFVTAFVPAVALIAIVGGGWTLARAAASMVRRS